MKIPVQALYDNCRMMINDKWGYIWGTAGKLWTQKDQDSAEREMTIKYGSKWIGHHVTDCSGVMVYIWSKYGLQIPHGSSSMVQNGYIVDCGSVPHPGWAAIVDDDPSTPENTHIGIVMEDGATVFEAKGTQAGCVYSNVSDRKWTKFGRFRDVNYEGSDVQLNTPYYATVVTQSGSLNVRSGPGTEYPKIGTCAKNAQVIVKTHGDVWDFINVNGLQGYVSNAYLRPDKEVPEEDPVVPDRTTLKDTNGSQITLLGIWEVVK